MRPHAIVLFLSAVCPAAMAGFSGCTVIGYWVGGAIENSKPDMEARPNLPVSDLEAGIRVVVTKTDSSRITGTFLRMDRVPPEFYAECYGKAAETFIRDSVLPSPDQVITLALTDEYFRHVGTFIGFDARSIHWRDNVSQAIIQSPFESLADIRPEPGKSISGEHLRALVLDQGIPAVTAMRILSSSSEEVIPTDEVAQVAEDPLEVTKKTQLVLTLVGAALDVAVVVSTWIYFSTFHVF